MMEVTESVVRGMDMDLYQDRALRTAVYPGQGEALGLMYVALKLNGEAGEFAEHLGKAIRDDGFGIIQTEVSEVRLEKLARELGDVLWYVAAAASELGFTLTEIAEGNLDKLASRAQRGTLQGSGDER